tara:strand:- start:1250 stop:2512 length:1263 start_codon:yes stop_codon:yes gene_type:complete
MSEIATQMKQMGEAARKAYRVLAQASSEQKNQALNAAAKHLRASIPALLEANAKDVQFGKDKGISEAMIDRLVLDEQRIDAIASGLEAIAKLKEPVGRPLDAWEGNNNGLDIRKVSVPLGVIGIIYESRPNVTADAGALCLKAGNACILRGGSESLHSSSAIVDCLHKGLEEAGLPKEAIQLIPTREREAVGEMLKLTGLIDIIVPRGGLSLTKRIAEESRIPTLQHLDGNCHVYVHQSADKDKAVRIVENAKLRRTGICGAMESLVIDEAVAADMLPAIVDALSARDCVVKGDAKAQAIDSRIEAATDADWGTEYLDKICSVKVVNGLDEAIEHVNQYSSHHTDGIVAEDKTALDQYAAAVDSAIIMLNSSTQFADGGEFGMGAEIGISTGRLHARGPVGCNELTTYKYVVSSDGAIRA